MLYFLHNSLVLSFYIALTLSIWKQNFLSRSKFQVISRNPYAVIVEPRHDSGSRDDFLGPLLLTWFNFNPSMDK